jgi:hypothetical protein
MANLLTHDRHRRVLSEELLERIVGILGEDVHEADALQLAVAAEVSRGVELGTLMPPIALATGTSYANESLSSLVS